MALKENTWAKSTNPVSEGYYNVVCKQKSLFSGLPEVSTAPAAHPPFSIQEHS